MYQKLLFFCTIPVFAITSSIALAASAVSISYGVVEGVQTVEHKGQHAGGAIAGGMLGAIVAGPRHRALKIGASAAAGAAVQGAVTSGTSLQYRVRLIGGGESIITTEQREIRQGDCVSVEQGSHANIRRVSNYHCEQNKQNTPPAHHKSGADNCQLAKNELAKAESDNEVDVAVKKVRVLCED